MSTLSEFISRRRGVERRQALNKLLNYYIPPNLRPAANFAGALTPPASYEDAVTGFEEALAPGASISQRVGGVGKGLSGTAGIVAPIALAKKLGTPLAEATEEAFLGFNTGTNYFGNVVKDRLTQPGEMPTLYSNPIPGLLGGEPPTSAPQVEKVGSDYFNPPAVNIGRARDPALFTEYSLNAKHKNAPYEWSTQARKGGLLNSPQLVTPADHFGDTFYFAAGDRTSGGRDITKVGNLALRRPVRMDAGAEFMDTGKAWASHRGVMVPKHNVLSDVFSQATQDGNKLRLSYAPMGERSGDFSKHQAALYAEMLYSSEIPSKSVKEIDDLVEKFASQAREAEGKKALKRIQSLNKKRAKKGLDPLSEDLSAFSEQSRPPSITSPEFRDWLSEQSAEIVRKPLLQTLDKAQYKNLEGVPDVGEARFAATNPDLVNSPSYSGGYRFIEPDIQRGLLASDHPTYDTEYAAMPGVSSQTYGVDIPVTIMARDTMLPRLKKGMQEKGFKLGQNDFSVRDYLLPADQRVMTMNPQTHAVADQQFVDEASRYMEINNTLGPEYARQYNLGLILDYLRRD